MATSFTVETNAAAINQALFQVTHGLYILTSQHGGRINGQCLDAMMQVTNMPPRVAVGVGKKSLTHEFIAASGIFLVNVLDREDAAWCDRVKHFGFQSGRKVDKFAGVLFERGENGCPILPSAKAFYECRVVPGLALDLGTHTLFVGLVVRAGVRGAGEPLTYNEYRKTLKERRG